MRNRARPKKRSTGTPIRANAQDKMMGDLLQDLSEFEEFRTQIIKEVRKDLLAGLTTQELRAKYLPLITARMISEALTTPDPGKAASIARDLTDRSEGKPTERKEITLKYADLGDEELDALLESEETDLRDMTVNAPKQ